MACSRLMDAAGVFYAIAERMDRRCTGRVATMCHLFGALPVIASLRPTDDEVVGSVTQSMVSYAKVVFPEGGRARWLALFAQAAS